MEQFNDIPADDLFLIASELRPIADSLAELLGTDKTTAHAEKLLHFQNRVVEWSDHGADCLDDDNAPSEDCLPLPPPECPPTLCERFAALAAIHDCFANGRHKINPWAWADEDESVSIKSYAKWIAPHTIRYDSLKSVVDECRLCRTPGRFGPYEPTDEQKSNRAALLAWLDDVREDLRASVDSAPQSADPQLEGDGANAGEEQQAPEGSVVEDGATVANDTEQAGSEAPMGEWTPPLAQVEVARRLTGKEHARFREIEPALKSTGYKLIAGTRKVRVRLDTMNAYDRAKLEKPT